ncbi:MAG: bifunctional folylpolyglutamate synthase/dihydrofolate synthase, partial [Woeseia sp.]
VLGRLRLGMPTRVIHIAGTNGKGSSAAMLEALLMNGGERVGVYMSPHLHRYNERIRLNGAPVSDDTIVSSFERVESARQKTPLTYFEFGTLAAMVAFEESDADTVVLEVGMGGRLDAVNAVEPDAGIITNVSLDHCDWLGEDIESIAAEKAGIFRPGKPFVFGADIVPQAILASAAAYDADLRLRGRDFDYQTDSGHPGSWAWSGREYRIGPLAAPALAGQFQIQNAAAVLALLEAIGLDQLLDAPVIDKALGQIELAGRCQPFKTDRNWLLDVAHNADAAKALSEYIAKTAPFCSRVAVIGVLADKDIDGIVSPLAGHVDTWVAVTAGHARAVAARELAAHIANLTDRPCLAADGVPEAMQYAHDSAGDDDVILVTGSFYAVGPALQWLTRKLHEIRPQTGLSCELRVNE